MNKKIRIPIFVSLAAAVLSIASFFFPFIEIENYRAISGSDLLIFLFRWYELGKKNSDAVENLIFRSTSFFLLLMFAFLLVSIVLLVKYLMGRKSRYLNLSILTVFLSFIFYGLQLGNSASYVSDFFGTLTQFTKNGNSISYAVPDIDTVATGLGARMLMIFSLISLLALLIAKFYEHELQDRSASLQTPFGIAYRQFRRNKLAIFGIIILAFFMIICFYGPVFSNFALLQTNIDIAKEMPSLQFPFGTDEDGRDVLTRILYGGRISLEVGIVTVLIEIVIGSVVGGVAGYYGGWVDNLLMRIDDIFLSLPFLPIVIIIGAVMMDMQVDPQKRIYFVMLILGLLFWPSLARLVRGQILSLREQEFMVAAKALGIRDRHQIFRHLVPNTLPNIIVTATLDVGNAILTESALSFLGLGVAVPYPSWGNIIQAVNDPNDFSLRPWLWIPAGICILMTVLAINLVGDGLRDAFDPKMKR